MLWIEDIVKNTIAPPFLTNFRIDMIDFVDLHKVVVRRSEFSTFPSAQHGVELECTRVESEGLNRQFSQVEGDLDLQDITKLVLISNKKAPRKKVIVVKDKDEKGEEVGKKIHCV